MLKFTEGDLEALTRTLFGEAEAHNVADAEAIASVVLNRVDLPNWPDTISHVCLQPSQFSCWNRGDPNLKRILTRRGPWYERCREIALRAAQGEIPDPTHRSTHYYATYVPEPKWARGHTPVYRVKHRGGSAHLFYNDIDCPAPKEGNQ